MRVEGDFAKVNGWLEPVGTTRNERRVKKGREVGHTNRLWGGERVRVRVVRTGWFGNWTSCGVFRFGLWVSPPGIPCYSFARSRDSRLVDDSAQSFLMSSKVGASERALSLYALDHRCMSPEFPVKSLVLGIGFVPRQESRIGRLYDARGV